jgi:hypothetical protein
VEAWFRIDEAATAGKPQWDVAQVKDAIVLLITRILLILLMGSVVIISVLIRKLMNLHMTKLRQLWGSQYHKNLQDITLLILVGFTVASVCII